MKKPQKQKRATKTTLNSSTPIDSALVGGTAGVITGAMASNLMSAGEARVSSDGNISIDADSIATALIADQNADGVVDAIILDQNTDGVIDAIILDNDFDGTVDAVILDSNYDDVVDAVAIDTNSNGILDVIVADSNFDSVADTSIILDDGEISASEDINSDDILDI